MVDFLILGADAAGLSAAVQIKRRLPDSEIRVISKGRIISYGACGIPYVISGDIPTAQKLVYNTPESFERTRGIPVRIRHEATGVFPQEHSVEIRDLDTGETYRETYGKLLIGTGAQPVLLPFIDYALEGVFNLHTIEDLERVLLFLEEKKPRRAALIGAGNIGRVNTLSIAGPSRSRGVNPTAGGSTAWPSASASSPAGTGGGFTTVLIFFARFRLFLTLLFMALSPVLLL